MSIIEDIAFTTKISLFIPAGISANARSPVGRAATKQRLEYLKHAISEARRHYNEKVITISA